uniref:T9SS type A sorting domain-containing protein n=1 Tax=Ignavibacterium album TaxID=591197 RepID=A0A7V3E8K9_9BACT
MDNTADVILTGAVAGDQFSYSVSTAGDVNGDGYSDVIVGALYNDAGGVDAGRTYIYFGGVSMDNTADVILTGAAANDLFGSSVSAAGDINGDGYSDVIVGAVYNDAGGTDAGRAYIYFGGVSMDNTADIILTGAAANDYFSYSVSTAGDVNGDGYSDVIVGAAFNDAGGSNAGRAYIYFGGVSMDNTADVILTGAAAVDLFGFSVSTSGDVNGDGYSDVIVGATQNDAGGDNAGRAYIYFGGVSMDNTADVILTGAADYNLFGISVATAKDINGDGYSDVIVGAAYNDAGGDNAGRAYIYFGGVSMDNTADIILTGAAANDYFSYSVSTAGDVNGDGYSDVIVGAYLNDAGGTDAGRAYVYLSSAPPVKPRIISVKDVPADQGGFVTVKWVRSSYDVNGIDRVTGYIIERSLPPGITGFAWEQIAYITARKNPFYLYTASTWSDSTSNNSGTIFFRVTAVTSNSSEYWRSNIMSGHSVDNLSPSAPLNFYATLQGSNVKLGWKANTEPDLYNYLIYRTNYPNANPDTLVVYAQSLDTIFIDTNPLSSNSYYYLRAQDVNNNLSQAVVDSISEQTTFTLTVTVSNGWNLVSVPGLHPVDQNVNTWWQYRDQLANVYLYNSGYQDVNTVQPGIGYWMKHSGSRTYNTGDEWPAIQIVPHNPINANQGWNLFGGYEQVVSVSALSTTPPGLITGQVYGYSNGYYSAMNLEPGAGYWVKLSGAGQINIPNSMANGKIIEYFPKEWGRIIIRDAMGSKVTLYSVTEEVDLDKYELPPVPPMGIFDVRYESGRIAERIDKTTKTIEIRGAVYPLEVEADGMEVVITDNTGKKINRTLKEGERLMIEDPMIEKLIVGLKTIPVEFSLEQNYPNPFNPTTRISWQSPVNSHQTLKVYDILGNEVATLVDEYREAGRYEVEFDASKLSSGMYLYQLKTDIYTETKKMILLR